VTIHFVQTISIAFSGLITRIILQNYKLGSAAQRHRLLIEHRPDGLARCLDVEAVLLDQVAAIGQDGVGILQHLQPLEVIERQSCLLPSRCREWPRRFR